MTTERERIERLKAEGKVSAEEAERLLAALEKSEREEAQAPSGSREEIKKPRLSRLAVAGAVALPAAAGLFVTAFGFGVAVGTSYERAAAGGAVAAAASLVAALILGACALVAILRTPAELRGRGLAWLGILAPLILTATVAIAAPLVIGHRRRDAAEQRARELAAAITDFARPESDMGFYEGMAIMARLMETLDPVELGAYRPSGLGEALDKGDLESALRISNSMVFLSRERRDSISDSIVGKKVAVFLKEKGLIFAGATFAPDLTTGEVTLRVAGDEAKGIVLPVVNREGRWYFSAEPVRFLGGEPEAPPKQGPDAVEPEGEAP